MDKKTQIGKQIVKLRKKNGYSQKDLAEMLHVSFQAVSKWERGISSPDLDTLHNLCDFLDTSFTYFLFDAYSTMKLEELINSLNESGITSGNYRSLGSLVRSGALDSRLINSITNPMLRKILIDVQNKNDELSSYSDLRQDHHIVRLYSDELSLSLDFNIEQVNEIKFKYLVVNSEYDRMIYAKTIARLVENTNNEFYLLIIEDEDYIEYKTACSLSLADRGVNCYFITDLALMVGMQQTVLSGGSGGGIHSHAGFRTKSQDLRENHEENAVRLVREYLNSYDREFKILFG